ncbi:peptide chain release factor 1 [Candidatus Pacearchaeota archaeon]|nr:peptide chain release factor 1 [Candidatus Pacearchaeota archaeon]|tara:strand:- start:4763 stop:5857 length:1095 start_codon:yes stop_codon:yes gene_type:complete
MALDEREKTDLEEFAKRMKEYKARHTELITVYVPAGFDINLITKQLESEKSTAANIKSTGTRKNVQEALESLIRVTKGMKQAPKNGIALFAGNVSRTEGQDDLITEVFEPPEELGVRLYRCDQIFVIDPLDEMLEVKEVFGLIVIERNEATLGLLIGKKIKVLNNFESFIPGKTNKGGQSAARYSRIRDGMAKEFFRKIAEVAKQEFFHLKELKGILVGGPGPTKEDFLREGQLVTELKEKVIAVKDIGYADEHGLELLVEDSSDVLAEQEIHLEKKLLEKFFNMLGKEKDKTAYKKEPVEKALGFGAVDTLYLSKKLNKKDLEHFENKAKETAVNIELISVDTEEGQQFFNLGGVGAILRFKI